MSKKALLSVDYPTGDYWKKLMKQFSPELNACKGIWRPDSLPQDADAREKFFTKFSDVSLKTLELQLSKDTVSKVNGRIARSFDDAVKDLSASIWRLKKEFEDIERKGHPSTTNGVLKKEK